MRQDGKHRMNMERKIREKKRETKVFLKFEIQIETFMLALIFVRLYSSVSSVVIY